MTEDQHIKFQELLIRVFRVNMQFFSTTGYSEEKFDRMIEWVREDACKSVEDSDSAKYDELVVHNTVLSVSEKPIGASKMAYKYNHITGPWMSAVRAGCIKAIRSK